MQSVRLNALANFLGQATASLITFICTPLFLLFLGVESYGLVTFTSLLLASAAFLDLGLTSAFARELASKSSSQEHRDLDLRVHVRTLELVLTPWCVFILLTITLTAPLVASHWLSKASLAHVLVSSAVTAAGLMLSAQMIASFYASGLISMQRQVEVNVIGVLFTALRLFGALPLMVYFEWTVVSFITWQAVLIALQALVLRMRLYVALPAIDKPPMFDASIPKQLAPFAINIFVIGGLSFILTQSDRIVVSRLLSLDQFASYGIAASIGLLLTTAAAACSTAFYPRYVQLVSDQNTVELKHFYHRSNQIVAVIIGSAAAMLCLLPHELLLLWTRNETVATNAALPLSLLGIAYGLNGLLQLPYYLQLAYGKTRLATLQLIISVVIALPATWLCTSRFGLMGAAMVWPALNIAYFCVGIPVMHRTLLQGEMKSWYLNDIILPAVSAIVAVLVLKWILPQAYSGLAGYIQMLFIAICAVIAAAMMAKEVRAALMIAMRSKFFRHE
jgi:O-antigen/teichoic acid export membrane protein